MNNLLNTMKQALGPLGLMRRNLEIAFYGLETQDIVSLIKTLKTGEYVPPEDWPALYLYREDLKIGENRLTACVPVANEQGRCDFISSLHGYDGVVYLFDVTNEETCRKAKEELEKIIPEGRKTKPVLILVPHPDASGVANEADIIAQYDLAEFGERGNGSIAVFAYTLSANQLRGYHAGFEWFIQTFKNFWPI